MDYYRSLSEKHPEWCEELTIAAHALDELKNIAKGIELVKNLFSNKRDVHFLLQNNLQTQNTADSLVFHKKFHLN